MRKTFAFAGLGLAAALVLSGCSTATEADEAPMDETESAVVDTVNSDGSNLRAQLTSLLTDHVYLAAAAIDQAFADGGDLTTANVQAAVAAVDVNSVELAALVGSAYPEAEQPFLDSWRSHIPMFVEYALGVATGDDALKEKAEADLLAYDISFGQLINSVVPELPAEAVQAELEVHGTTLKAAIDANAANDPAYFDLLKEAAAHMPMIATILAGGIATNLGIQ